MRKAISCVGLLLLIFVVLAGCGGGMSSTSTPSGTKMSQVSLTIHDNPPTGVTMTTPTMLAEKVVTRSSSSGTED